jgi:hypothetical protein
MTPLPRGLVAVVVSLGLAAPPGALGQDRVLSPNADLPYLGVNGTFTLDQQEVAARDPRNPKRVVFEKMERFSFFDDSRARSQSPRTACTSIVLQRVTPTTTPTERRPLSGNCSSSNQVSRHAAASAMWRCGHRTATPCTCTSAMETSDQTSSRSWRWATARRTRPSSTRGGASTARRGARAATSRWLIRERGLRQPRAGRAARAPGSVALHALLGTRGQREPGGGPGAAPPARPSAALLPRARAHPRRPMRPMRGRDQGRRAGA